MFNPIVSVIIPVFNAERFLEKTIESVLKQTLEEIEVLIVDDASYDNSISIVERYIKEDSRVKLYRNLKNRGPSYSRNVGIKESQGAWIAVLDADDFYSLKRLDVLTRMGEDLGVEIIADNMYLIDEIGNTLIGEFLNQNRYPSRFVSPENYILANMLHRNSMPALGYLKPVIRRSFLHTKKLLYANDNNYNEDFSFVFNCLISGARFYYLKKPFYFYRKVMNSLSKKDILNQLNSKLQLNHRHLNDPKIKENEKIYKLISKRQKTIERAILIEQLKHRQWKSLKHKCINHPLTFFILIFLILERISGKVAYPKIETFLSS